MRPSSPGDLRERFGDLPELSLKALPRMFDEGTGLFCQKIVADGNRHSNLVSDHTGAEPGRLEVLRECRSYHLGWLPHAYAIATE
jgi:hypothetical protein